MDRMFALHVPDLDSISGTPYGSLSPPEVIPEPEISPSITSVAHKQTESIFEV